MVSCRELIMRAVGMFSERDGAFLDCELLMMKALGVKREDLIKYPDSMVNEVEENLFWSYVKELYLGTPVAYILGKKEFYGLDFFVDERVLIPRPESELIVDLGKEFLLSSNGSAKVLDVGTGSGNIVIALAKVLQDEGKDIVGMGIDISNEALEVAEKNAESIGVLDKISFIEGNLMAEVEDGAFFDLITANLPYIGEVKHRYVSKETELYEPNVALFGGYDGLELYREMFSQMKAKNISFGEMYGEFGFAQAEDMESLLASFFENFEILPDLAGIPRVFVVRRN